MKNKQKPLIGIIGGNGLMGSWFKRFFASQELEVLIADLKTELTNKELAEKADIIIVSVPIRKTIEIISEITPHLKPDALLCDFTSVKIEPVKAMLASKCGVTGMHPLFGPLAQNLKNQNIVFCPARDNHWTEFLEELFSENGAKIIKVSPEDHDRQMAIVQSLTHFINISLLRTLYTENNKNLSLFSTPIFRLQSLIMGRIAAQNPELYADIEIHNPLFEEVLENYQKNIEALALDVKNKNAENFIKKFQESRDFLSEFVSFAEFKSSEVIDHLDLQSAIPTEAKIKTKFSSPKKIAYLGPVGTFSHQATRQIFDKEKIEEMSAETINEVFRMVNHNESDYGIVPIENSTTGLVQETIRGLIDFPVQVNGSYDAIIHHNLLAKKVLKKEEIKKIKSHPQVLAQCRSWINSNLPQAEIETVASSATAIAKETDEATAFIGSDILAEKYNLQILNKNIEDTKGNTTKFYLISNHPGKEIISEEKPRTLLLLAVYDRVGVLRDILDIFAKNNINLSRLHSIPSRIKKWDYYFFVEAEKSPKSDELKKSISELITHCPIIRMLGNG